MKHTLHRISLLLGCTALISGIWFFNAATEPELNARGILAFVAGDGFIKESRAVFVAAAPSETVFLQAYYTGNSKEAAFAEIPIVTNGVGLEASDNITSLKVSSSSKAVKASYDKKNNVIKLTTAGLGKGTVTVSGSLKDGKTTNNYVTMLDFVVMPPTIEKTEVGYKEKGTKELNYQESVLPYTMQVGASLNLQVRFHNAVIGYYNYGGAKANGVWQSLDPSYLSVSNDGKLKALTPTEDGQPARAVFIDYMGNMTTSVEVTIKPKENAKLDRWQETIVFQYKGTGKGFSPQTVNRDGSLTWKLSDGPFQLSAMVTDNKDKQVKTNVFYYTTDPTYAAVDSKGVCYPLRSTTDDAVSLLVYAVGLDFSGIKQQASFTLVITP